jgi:hypothetical protein
VSASKNDAQTKKKEGKKAKFWRKNLVVLSSERVNI